jgi:hypothetical protein
MIIIVEFLLMMIIITRIKSLVALLSACVKYRTRQVCKDKELRFPATNSQKQADKPRLMNRINGAQPNTLMNLPGQKGPLNSFYFSLQITSVHIHQVIFTNFINFGSKVQAIARLTH